MTTFNKILIAAGITGVAATIFALIYRNSNKAAATPALPPQATLPLVATEADWNAVVAAAKNSGADLFTNATEMQLTLVKQSFLKNVTHQEATILVNLINAKEKNWSIADKDMFAHIYKKVLGR